MGDLERVAVHQTRLRVPGVGLDARGVVLGARGLVLLPSLDRLVAFLAVYTQQHSLSSMVESLRIEVVCSGLGTRELALSFAASSSGRLDRISEVARLTGGFTFTGTSRHYIQFRDAGAPFGYDAREITATDASLVLYHTTFTQVYETQRELDLRLLLLQLMLHPDPGQSGGEGPLWVLAEPGLGPSLLAYLSRSGVDAQVGMVEWPPTTAFDEQPVRRFLFRVSRLPARMRSLLRSTPGISAFEPAAQGVAVEQGHAHPITLRACPVFKPEDLVLFRGGGAPPLEVKPLGVLAELSSVQRAQVRIEEVPSSGRPVQDGAADIRVPIRLAPSSSPLRRVEASLVALDELGRLRRLAYLLTPEALRTTRIAVTKLGAFLIRDAGIEALPLGRLYRQIHPSIYVPSGLEVVPAVSSDVLFGALGAPEGRLLFFQPAGGVLAVQSDRFLPLQEALLQPEQWTLVSAAQFDEVLSTELPRVELEPLGILPLRNAKSEDD